MKIALIQEGATIPLIFSPKQLEKLSTFGEVICNDGDTSQEQVKKIINDADIAVTSWGNEPFNNHILDEAPNLKLIAHAAGSVKRLIPEAVWERGIRVISSAKPLGQGVAETTLGFTISTLKNFYLLSEDCHAGGWNAGGWKSDLTTRNVTDLFEITIGVVGAGWAGRHYIKLLQNFEVEVLLYDPFVSAEKAGEMGAIKVEFNELLKRSDVVSVHAPSIPETNDMFNENTLKLMKKNAILINTARGSLINEKDLYKHMMSGNLKYACLDVYNPEPPAVDHPLRSLRNAILTPHVAGLSNNGRRRIGLHVTREIERFINDQPLEAEVTKEALARMA